MSNILICVVKCENIDKTMKKAIEIYDDERDKIYLMSVGSYEMYYMDKTEEEEELDYIYKKALEYGAKVKVLRSNNLPESIKDFIVENNITHLVTEETRAIRGLRELTKSLPEVKFLLEE